jgi:hypothetical protein
LEKSSHVSTPTSRSPKKPFLQEFVKVLDWLRQLGFATFLIGFIGAISDPSLFWLSVCLFYFGAGLILLDLIFQTDLLKKSKWIIGVATTGAIFYFSKFFVFVPAQLEIIPLVLPLRPELANQITWHSNFSSLQIDFYNQSTVNLDDVALVIKPSKPVTAAMVISAPSDASLKPLDSRVPPLHGFNTDSGKAVMNVPLTLIATDQGYSMRCASVLPGEHIVILLAMTEMPQFGTKPRTAPPKSNEEWSQQFLDPTYCLKMNWGKYSCWFGYPAYGDFKPLTGSWNISIEGTYVAAHRRRGIKENLEPIDEMNELRKQNLIH